MSVSFGATAAMGASAGRDGGRAVRGDPQGLAGGHVRTGHWLTRLFDGLPATAAHLSEDRILEEARAADGDPLHIAAMLGLIAKAALRYAKTDWPDRSEQPSRDTK